MSPNHKITLYDQSGLWTTGEQGMLFTLISARLPTHPTVSLILSQMLGSGLVPHPVGELPGWVVGFRAGGYWFGSAWRPVLHGMPQVLPWGLSCLTSPVESWGGHKGSYVRFADESKVVGPGLIQLGAEGTSGYYERHRDNTVPDCA